MKKNYKTKRLAGTDLGPNRFLFVGDINKPGTWLLPCCDPTSREKTVRLLTRNLERWEQITDHIPSRMLQRLRWELEGAAQSYGIDLPPASVSLSEAEMDLLQEASSFASRMLALAEINSLYD
jgi:hypothetical protein